MGRDAFYQTAAQVIPTLGLVIALEMRRFTAPVAHLLSGIRHSSPRRHRNVRQLGALLCAAYIAVLGIIGPLAGEVTALAALYATDRDSNDTAYSVVVIAVTSEL